jgi:DNA polymerase I
MEFQVLDVDYTMVNEKPVLRLFGKDAEGKSVCGFYEGFLPYFYALGEDIEGKLEGIPHVLKLEKVKRTLPVGYQEPRDVNKITLRDPGKTVEVRETLRSMGVETYEADVLFKYRWMNDFGLGGMKWVGTEQENGINTSSVSAKRLVQIKDFKVLEKYEDAPLRFVSLDIETVSSEKGSIPDAEKDPVVMIALVFRPHYRKMESVVLSTRAGSGVEVLGSEKEMLERFIEIINEHDSDVITGFNIVGYDLPYILTRMQKNKVRPVFGRCKGKGVRDDVFAGRHRISITGRVIADAFSLIKKGWSLKRYGLDFVAKELLGEEKHDVKKSEIGSFWNGSQEQYMKLVNYCRKDSELALNLLLRLNLLDKFVALSKISGTLLNDILEGGESQRIENYFLREFNKEGYIIPTKSNGVNAENNNGKDQDFKGGYVIEPKKGLHSMVLVFDFKSMYPSLIRTYNICPTTLLLGNDRLEHITTPTGSKFVKKEIRHGIVPRILENLMKERSAAKKQFKDADGEKLRNSLNLRQHAIKIMANAFYGYFGYTRAKIHNVAIASSVTAFGRETIHQTVKAMEEDFGYEVVYGDTDSVMIKVPTEDMEEASKIGRDVAKKLTEKLPGVMELEFEKIFKRFLPLTKKRYMGWSVQKDRSGEWKDDIVMKGIETVRRDWCELTGETMSDIIEIILKKNDVKAAVNHFKEVVDDLLGGKMDVEKLVITKTLTRKPENYAGIQPHVEVIKKMQQRNEMDIPGTGDRIGYVIVKGMEMLSKRAEDPAYVKEKGISIDPRYYIDNQLLPPLERIFDAIGISKEELLGMGRQMGLMDAINNHKSPQKELEKASVKEIDGLLCPTCSRRYRMPPLVGKCECGGSLIFSTPSGTADIATFV